MRPRHLAPRATAQCPFGDEVEDPALALGIARIPVLDGRILYLGIFMRVNLDHRGMELVLVAHRRGAAFEIADVAALFGDDQGALELAGILGVDPEIGRQFHRAADALGDVDEGAVGEDRGVEAGEQIVALRNDRAEVFLDEVGIFLDRFADRQEDHPGAQQFLAEGGRDADAVEHRIDRDFARAFDPGEHLLLLDRDAEFLIDAQDFGIDLVERSKLWLRLGRGVIISVLIIDRRNVELGPVDLLHLQPRGISLEPPVEHPLRLVLLGGDEADGVFGQALGREVGLDVRAEAPLIILGDRLAEFGVGRGRVVDAVGHYCCAPAKAEALRTGSTGSFASKAPACAGAHNCLKVTALKAPRTASPTIPMCGLIRQCESSAQSDGSSEPLHWVMAIGPSTASTMSARLIAVTSRARA